jgi:hypothetical protein
MGFRRALHVGYHDWNVAPVTLPTPRAHSGNGVGFFVPGIVGHASVPPQNPPGIGFAPPILTGSSLSSPPPAPLTWVLPVLAPRPAPRWSSPGRRGRLGRRGRRGLQPRPTALPAPAPPAPPRSPRAPEMVRCCPVREYWLLGKIRNCGN